MVKYESIDVIECEKLAEKLACGAGAIIKEYFGSKIGIEFKDGKEIDPVTEVDFKCQEFISNEIKKYYPDHEFIGEESDKAGNKSHGESKYVWVVDPLDGTLNFTSNFPLFSSSIALLYDGEPIVGAIHLPWPYTEDGIVVHASIGNGVFCDEMELEDFLINRSKSSSLAIFPEGKHSLNPRLKSLKQIENRNTGSIATDLALVGMNVLRYAVARSPRIWDVAAGVIIVKEAGGSVIQAIEPNKIKRMISGQKIKFVDFHKFKQDPNKQESEFESLKNWSGTLILGEVDRI